MGIKGDIPKEQIIGFLREADAGIAVSGLCRRHRSSEPSYYLWGSKFGGLSVLEAKQQVWCRKRRKVANGDRRPLLRPTAAIQACSTDFVFDWPVSCRARQCLAIVEDATHKGVAIELERAISGIGVTGVRDRLGRSRGLSQII